MKKNILVLTGSPRKGGNSDTLADAFSKGAKAKGHSVTRFEAAHTLVQGCRACDACWSKGKACVFDDGFDVLAPMLEKADVLAVVTPVYWFGFTAQIKAAIDKMYSFLVPACKTEMAVKESVLVICAGDTDVNVFTGSIETYKGIADFLKWTDRGIVTVPGVMEKGEIAGKKALADVEKLGADI